MEWQNPAVSLLTLTSVVQDKGARGNLLQEMASDVFPQM
jgi:hypothetical protein